MELWLTDKCFLIMLVIGFVLILRSLRVEQTREAFKRIFHQPLAVCSSIIMVLFLLIAVLDSVHFKEVETGGDTSITKVVSILDKLLAPLGQIDEKTYSAPLALTLYSSEILINDGQFVQVHPRLKYPPAFLKNSVDSKRLIVHELIGAFVWSLASIMLIVGVSYLLSFRGVGVSTNFNTIISSLVTLFFCLLFIIASYKISRYFHLFGTGKTGQDIFYYTVKSIRTGLIIGTLTTLFMLPLAIILGIMAGYFGGIIDDIIQYVYTTLSSIPGVLLITASVLSMQTYIANHPQQFPTLDQSADARLLALCIILGVTSWTSLCRLLRAEALKLREIDFVIAAKALGSSSVKIIHKHLLPNVMPIVIITLVLDFSYLVLAEAVLSYVGVGVSPMTISWGNMINGARLELSRDPIVWWPMLAAFIFMFILVLACNLLADAVRDAFDPHHA